MNAIHSVFLLCLLATSLSPGLVCAFNSFVGTPVMSSSRTPARVNSSGGRSLSMEYIPSGMSKEAWKKLKEKESAGQKKNLGRVGITTFKSRSFTDWQKSGGKNLFPVDPTKVKNPKEIPYMQRPGGSADDSDISKKSNPFGKLFGGGNKKKETKPEPKQEKGTNWWTLN